MTCDYCGRTSTDPEAFMLINIEAPSMSMDDPYPGYAGDYVCNDSDGIPGGCVGETRTVAVPKETDSEARPRREHACSASSAPGAGSRQR